MSGERRAFAIVASVLAPGAGQFMLGRPWRGLAIFALLPLLALLFPVAGLWVILPWLVLYVGQLFDVGFMKPRVIHSWRFCVAVFVAGFVVAQLARPALKAFYVEAFKIPSGGMIPTLQVGDHIFAEKWARRPERGEVIVFRYPREPDKVFVKRAVAVGGDTIELRAGVPVVNGVPAARRDAGPCEYDDFADDSGRWETRRCHAFDETIGAHEYRVIYDPESTPRDMPPQRVPDGGAFVMGDNRDNSHDSRFWGPVPRELIVGRAGMIWFSSGKSGIRWDRMQTRVR